MVTFYIEICSHFMADLELPSGIGYTSIESWLKANFDFCLACIVINLSHNRAVSNELINTNMASLKKYNLDY